MGKMAARRNYKDSLFRMVFREKRELLSLYNAINGTDYDDPEELIVTTIEDVLYMGCLLYTSCHGGRYYQGWRPHREGREAHSQGELGAPSQYPQRVR